MRWPIRILVQVYMHIWKVQSTYFCELFCMALCNFALLIFCLCLEIWCIFRFSNSRLAFWKASYHNLQNADRETVKMRTISVRLCPQSCPQSSHDESRHTSVEALMWRWTLCCDIFLDLLNFLNYSSHTKIALQNSCKRRLCIDMRALPVLYIVGIAKTMFWRLKQDPGPTFWIITIIRSNLHLRPSSPCFCPRPMGGGKNHCGNKNFPKKHFEGELRPCLAFVYPCQGITIVFWYPSTRIDEMTN